MAIKDELGSGWIHNPSPLRKPERDQEPPEDNPLDEHCPACTADVDVQLRAMKGKNK
jgi:hypothetical protein